MTATTEPGKTPNPANPLVTGKPVAERKRIPMSVPILKLEIPEGACPGFHLYWFLDRNIQRAIRAGYEFVNADEVSINQVGIATGSTISGNSDMGTRVSIPAGVGPDNQPEHLYLMKIKQEWWTADQKEIEKVNTRTMDAIFKEKQVAGSDKVSPEDREKRYVKTSKIGRE